MFSMRPQQIEELCLFAFIADKQARSDLVSKYIVNENDYTSNFTGALRRIINSNSVTGLTASSHLISRKEERQFGCDAVILISANGYFKSTLFECKWPRFSIDKYPWDYEQTCIGLSHFSDQLVRQMSYAPVSAIFEMFFCEFQFNFQPPFMKPEVSSCVWHDDAVQFDLSRNKPFSVWSQSELIFLLEKNSIQVDQVLREVCNCNRGKAITYSGDISAFIQEFSQVASVLHISALSQNA